MIYMALPVELRKLQEQFLRLIYSYVPGGVPYPKVPSQLVLCACSCRGFLQSSSSRSNAVVDVAIAMLAQNAQIRKKNFINTSLVKMKAAEVDQRPL